MIDAHVHLGPPKYAAIDELRVAMDRHGLSGAVLVQHLGSTDNTYLAACREQSPDRLAALGIPQDLAAAERLLEEGFAGFRLSPRGLHHDPGETGVWAVAERAGGTVSVTGPFDELADRSFARVVANHPGTTFRLEHFAWLAYGDTEDALDRFRPILELASFPNVSMMWSGYFVNSGRPYPYPDAWPLMRAALDHFGSARLMWSGDWNRAGCTPADYDDDIHLLDRLPFLSAEDRVAIRTDTAARLFGLPPAHQTGRPR